MDGVDKNFSVLQKNESGKTNSKPLIKPETVDTLKRIGIQATALLPFSSRGIVAGVLKFPVRIVQSLRSGSFKESMKKFMKMDWHGGISDWYTRIDKKEHAEIIKKGAQCATMIDWDNAKQWHKIQGWVSNIQDELDITGIPNAERVKFDAVPENLKSKLDELGFKQDDSGERMYNPKTGDVVFVVKKDKKDDQYSLCIQGLGLAQKDLSFQTTFQKKYNELQLSGLSKKELKEKLKDSNLKNDEFGRILIKALIDQPSNVYQKPEECAEDYYIAFLAAKAKGNAVKEFFGFISDSSRWAMDLGKALFGSKNISIIGNSHGGGVAQVIALTSGLEAHVFQSRPMGGSVRRLISSEIGLEKFTKRAENITVFSQSSDILSGTGPLNVLAVWFERITGISLPRSVGKGYHVQYSHYQMHGGYRQGLKDMIS